MLAIYTTSAVCLATPNMNKDAVFATLIGLAIGLILTGIILIGPNALKSLPHINGLSFPKITLPKIAFPQKKNIPTPSTPVQKELHTVSIESPLEDAIETTDQVLISGTTSKESKVIIQGFVDDVVVMTNGDGKYAGKVTVNEGKNEILVTSYHEKDVATQTITIYYTPENW